jgi:hypothetical protein
LQGVDAILPSGKRTNNHTNVGHTKAQWPYSAAARLSRRAAQIVQSAELRHSWSSMHVFEVVTALLLGGALLALLARQIGTPYPALIALAGAVLAMVPGTPTLVLDPDLALALFVAPVLMDVRPTTRRYEICGRTGGRSRALP